MLSASATCCAAIRPGRNTAGIPWLISTMVDSIPTSQGPPSTTRSTASPSSSRTCCADVADRRPNRLADGAAIPPPNARNNRCAIGCEGTRTPTVSCPPVTRSLTWAARLNTMVSGPGQNFSASAHAPRGTSAAQYFRSLASATCTITGWSAGRPLAANSFLIAAGFEASAPSPYTVSVGKATSPPSRRIRAAGSIWSSLIKAGCRSTRQQAQRFFIFFAGFPQHVFGQIRCGRLLVPFTRFKPVPHELLVKGRRIRADAILVFRPEAGGIRRQCFIDKVQGSGFVLSELELGIRDNDAACERICGSF